MTAEWVDLVAQAGVVMAEDWLTALGGLIALFAAISIAGLVVMVLRRLI